MDKRLTRVTRVQEIWSSNPGPTKSYTSLQTVRHRFNIYVSSCVDLALWHEHRHRKLVKRFGIIRRA